MCPVAWSILLSETPRRRALGLGVSALGLLLAGGCGFQPIHGGGAARNGAAGGQGDIAADLAAVQVPVIPERFGQLTRRGLQHRLGQGTAGVTAARYELRVQPALLVDGVAIQPSGGATRLRTIATAQWTLVKLGTPPEAVANGFERALDASNIPTSQYFAADYSRDAAFARLADTLAEEVVTRVAMVLRRQRDGQAQAMPVDAAGAAPAASVAPRDPSGGGVDPLGGWTLAR
jgi:LPS-assembly lipoprotein